MFTDTCLKLNHIYRGRVRNPGVKQQWVYSSSVTKSGRLWMNILIASPLRIKALSSVDCLTKYENITSTFQVAKDLETEVTKPNLNQPRMNKITQQRLQMNQARNASKGCLQPAKVKSLNSASRKTCRETQRLGGKKMKATSMDKPDSFDAELKAIRRGGSAGASGNCMDLWYHSFIGWNGRVRDSVVSRG